MPIREYDGWWSVGGDYNFSQSIIDLTFGRFCEKCGAKLVLSAMPTNRFEIVSGREIEKYTLSCPSGKLFHTRHTWKSDSRWSYN